MSTLGAAARALRAGDAVDHGVADDCVEDAGLLGRLHEERAGEVIAAGLSCLVVQVSPPSAAS